MASRIAKLPRKTGSKSRRARRVTKRNAKHIKHLRAGRIGRPSLSGAVRVSRSPLKLRKLAKLGHGHSKKKQGGQGSASSRRSPTQRKANVNFQTRSVVRRPPSPHGRPGSGALGRVATGTQRLRSVGQRRVNLARKGIELLRR